MSDYHRARYQRLKIEGRCVDCTAGLSDDATSTRCVECSARALEVHRRWYQATKEKRLEWERAYRQKPGPKERHLERNRLIRQQSIAAGLCPICHKRDSDPWRRRCTPCHEQFLVAQRARRARKRNEVAGREG